MFISKHFSTIKISCRGDTPFSTINERNGRGVVYSILFCITYNKDN